ARSIWTIGKGAARVSAGTGVVSGPESNSAIGTIDPSRGPIHSCIRVVPCAVSVCSPVGVVARVIAAIPVVRWVIPTRTPDGAAPTNHHAGVTRDRRICHPVIVVVVILLDSHVGDAVRWR